MNGDGFLRLPDGSVRWGRYGAAGVLLRHGGHYFVAQRSMHSHQGGTWAVPGGALNSDEEPIVGALREFAEEIGVPLDQYEVVSIHEDDHGGWSYWTIVVEIAERFDVPDELHWETAACAWVTVEEMHALELFPAFRATLGRLGVL